VTSITAVVNIFDVEQFDAEVQRLSSATARADTILHQVKRTASERMDEDPAFYRKFSELVEETIAAYRQGRIDELEYLRRAQEGLAQMRSGHAESLPPQLHACRDAPAYYGVIRELLADYGLDDHAIADIAVAQEGAIEAHKVRDWDGNRDVQNQMKRALDDIFYAVEGRLGAPLRGEHLDVMIDRVIEVAKARR
jgi:type I restriction enzyme R subunit